MSDLVHESREPVFITRNGEGDMVLMSMKQYSRLQLKLELLAKLGVAEAQRAAGEKGRTLRQVMKDVRRNLRESV
jgi:prevent-host-death family protein